MDLASLGNYEIGDPGIQLAFESGFEPLRFRARFVAWLQFLLHERRD